MGYSTILLQVVLRAGLSGLLGLLVGVAVGGRECLRPAAAAATMSLYTSCVKPAVPLIWLCGITDCAACAAVIPRSVVA